MLLGAFAALSLVIGIGVCALCGAFAGMTWLWLLPVTALGCLLLLVLLAFLFLLFLCSRVDQSVPQEDDDPLYRKVADLYIQSALPVLKIFIKTSGMEKVPQDGRFMLVCNHLAEIDPVVLMTMCRKSQLAFISKRENDQRFLIGPFLHRILCQPINRETDREALKTILKCVELLKEDQVSIGVFPEGWVSLDEKLHPLRPGVFKIAQKANVPVVVCTLQDTQTVMKKVKKLKSATVKAHVVGVIPAEELKGVPTVQIAERVHAMMAADLGPENVLQQETT